MSPADFVRPMWPSRLLRLCLLGALGLARPSEAVSKGGRQLSEALEGLNGKLKLVQLQIVMSHGDLTPNEPLADRAYWGSQVPDAEALDALAEATLVLHKEESWNATDGDEHYCRIRREVQEIREEYEVLHNALSNQGIRRVEERGIALRQTLVENWPPRSRQEELNMGGVFTADGGRMVFHPATGNGLDPSDPAYEWQHLDKPPVFSSVDIDHGRGPFLPADYEPGLIRCLSTDYARTVRSAQAFIRGLFPLAHREGSPPIEIDTTREDELLPDPPRRLTKRQIELEREILTSPEVAKLDAESSSLREKLAAALEPLLQRNKYDSSATIWKWRQNAFAERGLAAWHSLAELSRALQEHGRLPEGLTAADVAAAAEQRMARWRALTNDTRLSLLAMKPLLTDMVEQLTLRLGGGQTRLQLYSTHPSAILALLGALRLDSPQRWPSPGSSLTIEVFNVRGASASLDDGTPNAYVRFSLDGHVLRSVMAGYKRPLEFVPFPRLQSLLRDGES